MTLVPSVFLVYGLWSGSQPMRVVEVDGDLYNLRMAVVLLVPAALFTGYLVSRLSARAPGLRALGVGLVVAIGSASLAVALRGGGESVVTEVEAAQAWLAYEEQREVGEWVAEQTSGRVLVESIFNEWVVFPNQDRVVYEGSAGAWDSALERPADDDSDIDVVVMRTTPGDEDSVALALHGSPRLAGFGVVHNDDRVVRSMGTPGSPDLLTSLSNTTLDLAGFGHSDRVPGPATLEKLADTALATLDALGETRPAHVMGNSLGGAVALLISTRHPERVVSLVLADPAGFGAEVTPALRVIGVPLLGRFLLGHLDATAARRSERSLFVDGSLVTDERVARAVEIARRPEFARTFAEVAAELGTVRGVRPGWRRAAVRRKVRARVSASTAMPVHTPPHIRCDAGTIASAAISAKGTAMICAATPSARKVKPTVLVPRMPSASQPPVDSNEASSRGTTTRT